MWYDVGGSDHVSSAGKVRRLNFCCGTLPDPSRPTGPAEFLPILLALTPSESPGDPLSSSGNVTSASTTALGPANLLSFLNDLAAGTEDVLSDVLTPTLSLFFQEWFKIDPTPDIMGNEWRKYLGAVATLVQVKAIAALVSVLIQLCSP